MAKHPTPRALVIIGYLSLLSCLTYSILTPAPGYELSIYAATPIATWILLSIAFTTSIISVLSRERRIHYSGIVLAIGSVSGVAGIPIIRSYYFYGSRDALTHLGLVKSFVNGTMTGESIIYPLTHVFAATIARLLNTTPPMALMILIPAFITTYVLSGYLLGLWLTRDRRVGAVAMLSACFLLPLMGVRVPVPYPIPNTFGVFYFLFILFVGVRAAHVRRNIGWFTILGIASAAAAVLHPLLGGAMVAVFVTMAVSVLGLDLNERSILPAVFSLWTILWIIRFGSRFKYFIAIWSLKVTGIGGDVARSGESLRRIGISLSELALRLAGIKLIFLFLSFALGVWLSYTYYLGEHSLYDSRQLALAIGVIPLGIGVSIFFVLGISNQWSRFLGFTLVIVTVLGAVGIVRISDKIFETFHYQNAAIALAFLLMMVPAAMVIHPSPYLIRPSQQVSEAQATGYGHAFSTQASDIRIAGLYSVPKNFRHAHYGTIEAKQGRGIKRNSETVKSTRPPPHLAESPETAFPEQTYLIVTDTAVRVHLEIFQSEVQRREDIESLDESPSIRRIYDNGDTRQYLFK